MQTTPRCSRQRLTGCANWCRFERAEGSLRPNQTPIARCTSCTGRNRKHRASQRPAAWQPRCAGCARWRCCFWARFKWRMADERRRPPPFMREQLMNQSLWQRPAARRATRSSQAGFGRNWMRCAPALRSCSAYGRRHADEIVAALFVCNSRVVACCAGPSACPGTDAIVGARDCAPFRGRAACNTAIKLWNLCMQLFSYSSLLGVVVRRSGSRCAVRYTICGTLPLPFYALEGPSGLRQHRISYTQPFH